MKRPGNIAARAGFTLIELLVALALLGMIMASVSASLDLYWKYRTLSQDRMSSAQILRGIVEDLSTDLRSVAAPYAPASATQFALPLPPGSGTPSGQFPPASLERTLRIQERHLNLTDSGSIPLHFAGSSNWLAMLTHFDSPRFAADASDYSSADAKHVVWWCSDQSSLRVPLAENGGRLTFSTLSPDVQTNGLVRVVRPFHENQTFKGQTSNRQTGSTGAVNSLRESSVLISDRITAMQFRYFDGANWVSEWNSATSFSIPRAVEVSMAIKNQNDVVETFVIWIPQG